MFNELYGPTAGYGGTIQMAGKYIFTTPISEQDGSYYLAEGLKKVMSPPAAAQEEDFIPPENLGEGRCVRLLSNDSCDIFSNELRLARKARLSAGTEGPLYALQFCMGSNMEWQEEASGARLGLQSGQGTFSFIAHILETGEYQAGEHYKSFRVNFSKAKMERMVEEFGIDIHTFSRKRMNFSMSSFETTPECKIALEQIARCHYKGAIRHLYIESKAHELFAYCMDALQHKQKTGALSLSKNDLENLRRAKEIVDNHIANPVSLAKLSRMAYLNEYKLKNGFKALFGKPVYTYLLDKRMEYARLLLEKRRFHVYEVAEMTGYADSSSFSKAFFKRYGYRPVDAL
ncbi:MAG: AraC family transcriptional regulator [Spirochaetales bacterium]|jgi:AraC-like DNA-binding protein|nr:AraC family transcriptional regulator [Spirochaetales bacterium]